MKQATNKFLDSIGDKIKQYSIPVKLTDAVSHMSEMIVMTTYNNGKTELVDSGVEWFLCKSSSLYFLMRYAWIDFPGTGVIPFKLYYFQEETLKDLLNYRKIIMEKTRQCLAEDNFVMTDRGYISIKDVMVGDKIETIVNGSITFVEIQNSFYTGKREVCHILTNSGLTIDCTLDHKIFTKRGWIEAGGLTLADEIISIVNKGKFGDFELNDNKFAAFIGYYMADGRYNSPSFVNTNINYINEMMEIGELFENCSPYIYERKKDEIRKQAYDVRFVSKSKNPKLYRPIKNFIYRFGLDILSERRCLTNELMNLKESQMSILLNRLYAGDGWITHKRDKRRPSYIQYEIGFGSPCFKLIKQIEYILQTKYGIHCYIMECFDKRNKDKNRFWKLRISQKKSVINFINKIGIKGKTDSKEIINLISKETPSNINQSFEKIRKIIHKEGMHDVYDITTESSDFLTNGLLVHNCGMSTVTSLYCFWRANFHDAEEIDVVSIKQLKAQAFVAKMDSTNKRLPEFLKTPIVRNNMQVVKFANGSRIISESQSDKAGRSDSLSLLVLDEAAHYRSDRMVRGIIASAQPTLGRTGGQFVIISTPNGVAGAGSYYHEQVVSAKSGLEEDTKLISVDWWEVPDTAYVPGPQKGYNQKLIEAIKEGYFRNEEVKAKFKKFFDPIATDGWRDNPWLKKQMDDLQDILYKQEVLHSFIVGEHSVFNEDVLKRVDAGVIPPILKDKLGNNRIDHLWIWKNPTPKHRYILGADVSTGTGKDSSSIQIMDVETYEQVAEYKGFISTKLFGRFITMIAKYYNQAFVVIECNSIGEAVFNEVYYNDNDPYQNVFKQTKTKNKMTRQTGWITDVKTRKLLTNELIDWLVLDELWEEFTINSKRLHYEMTTWVWDGTRPDHADGAHDDTLIAMALCVYLRNKVEEAGESFLINDAGQIIEYDSKDNSDEGGDDVFSVFFSDEESSDIIQEKHGMSAEEYKWVINK